MITKIAEEVNKKQLTRKDYLLPTTANGAMVGGTLGAAANVLPFNRKANPLNTAKKIAGGVGLGGVAGASTGILASPFVGSGIKGLDVVEYEFAEFLTQRVAFLPSVPETLSQSVKMNHSEAQIAARLTELVYRQYAANSEFDPALTLGIITPYRSQVALIKKEIAALGIAELNEILVDTVERFQGSERAEVGGIADEDAVILGEPVFQFGGSTFIKFAEHKVGICRHGRYSFYPIKSISQSLCL